MAIPVANNLNILGAHGINTSAAGSTVTVAINNAILLGDLSVIASGADALTCTTGDISILSGNFNLPTTSDINNGVVEVNGYNFIHSYGTANAFLGQSSGNFTLSGAYNTGIGFGSLNHITSGSANSALGYYSGFNIAAGSYNNAVGFGALNGVCGDNNNAFGYNALSNYTGSGNTAFGAAALGASVTGAACTAVGFQALLNSDGVSNTAVGTNAGGSLNAGTFNTALGDGCLINLQTGSYNLGLGQYSGQAFVSAESSNIIIANSGVVGDYNTIRIGNQGGGNAQQNKTYIAGIVGVTPATPTMVVIDPATGQLGTGPLQSIVASSFVSDSGTAVPSSGVLNILGTGICSTTGAGNTITVTAAGQWVPLSTQTISSPVAKVKFEGLFSGTYGMYAITVQSANLDTVLETLALRFGTGGTPTYQSTLYYFVIDSTTSNDSQSSYDVIYLLTGTTLTTSPNPINGIIYFYNVNNAATYPQIDWTFSSITTGTNIIDGRGAGFRKNAEALTAVEFFAFDNNIDSLVGNINAGIFTLYGIRQS